MRISYTHESIRLMGRWDMTNPHYAETTTTGAYIEFAFEGTTALAIFDLLTNETPLLRLWIQVDGGALTEAQIDRYLRISTPTGGKHVVKIIYKGGAENHRRWYRPLGGKVSFIGVQTEKPVAIGEDTRKTIEFVGDSITEGVLIDVDYYEGVDGAEPVSYIHQHNRVYEDDVCATYAWQTAQALNLRPIFMGYGAVGVTRAGQGKVPAAPQSYPYNFDGSPITRPQPDYILINHGANDRSRTAKEYTEKYRELLDVIRHRNPDSKIISLSAFCGAHHKELGKLIQAYNKENGDDISFIDSNGWISPEPLHPLRDGHKTVAEHLVPLLREIIK